MSMKLSEAMKAGCEKVPVKITDAYLSVDRNGNIDGCCALGAAWVGLGMTETNPFKIEAGLRGAFPILGLNGTIEAQIVFNNDRLGKSREEIAADLAAQGY